MLYFPSIAAPDPMNQLQDEPSSDGATCWNLIRAAAAGSHSASDQFAKQYEPVIRRFLMARWNSGPWQKQIDDAVQDVFVECIRPGGILGKMESGIASGFRAYLFGVVRNVIRRYESRKDLQLLVRDVVSDESSLGKVFDREFARAVMKEASQVQTKAAEELGPAAVLRIKLLHTRFHDNLPIRDIAKQWAVDPAWLHHEYATARAEFRQALMKVIATHQPMATDAENEKTCKELLAAL
jgi:RNA polymerase sigma-70 factor (ECF subfamily)